MLPLLTFGLIAGAGCGATRVKTSEAPAQSDGGFGVAVDPLAELPRPVDVAKESDSVATLRAPLPPEMIAGLVRRYFDAYHTRSSQPIEADLDEVIVDLHELPNGAGDRTKMYWIADFSAKVKGLPYDQVEVEQMYRSQDVEVYSRETLGQPGRPPRPTSMGADDVLVRIPIATPRLGADILFGDEIVLLLRRVGTAYKIHGELINVPR
ncbi:MAG: hypothetical protein ABI175_27105 [Polyangiales bacterium]